MRSPTRWMAIAIACLFVSHVTPVSAKYYDKCTPEQESAYEPYELKYNAVGCDEYTFETCTDDCLNMYETAAQHAPDCCPTYEARQFTSYLERATKALNTCKKVREDSTNKYFPQAVPGVPQCDFEVNYAFIKTLTAGDCFYGAYLECSDDCLKTIENTITTAPFCAYKHYSLGESTKEYLVNCLNARNASLWSNHVLTTIVTPPESSSSTSLLSTSVAVVLVVVLSLS